MISTQETSHDRGIFALLPGKLSFFIGNVLLFGLGMTGFAFADVVTASPSSVVLTYTIGDISPPRQVLTLTGPAGASFSMTGDQLFFGIAPAIGTLPANVEVTPFTAYMKTPGVLHGNITLTVPGATNSPLNIPITVTVSAGTLVVPGGPLTFNYSVGGSTPPTQPVNITGGAGIAFTTSTNQSWLTATASAGTIPATVNVGVSPSGLAPGTYGGLVTVTAPTATPSSATIEVTLNVGGLTTSPSALTFSYQVGGTSPPSQPLSVGGSSGLAFTAAVTSGGSWLAVAPAGGTVPATVNASINTTGLAAGTYSGNIAVSGSGVPTKNVPVTLTVTPAPALSASPTSLSFSYTQGGANPSSKTVSLGGSGLSFTLASDSPWLSATPTSGTTPVTATVSVNPASLATGTYHGNITVSATGAGNSPLAIPVTFTVAPKPTVTVTPPTLNFVAVLGGSNPPTETVNVTATAATPVSAAVSGASWLSVTLSSSQTPTVITAAVNPAGLAEGTYTANVVITTPSATVTTQSVPVTLNVISQSQITTNPTSLTLTGRAKGPAVTAPLNLASASPASFTVSAGATSWLTVSPATGTTPATVTVTADPTSLAAGPYSGSLTITGEGLTPVTVPVTFNVTAPVIDHITDAAGYQTDAFAPGMIISIFGSNLGPDPYVSFQLNSTGGVDPTLADVSITVDGTPAIPLFVSGLQINAILPYSARIDGQAAVVVKYLGAESAAFSIPMAPSAIRLFSLNFTGTGPGAILNQDYSVNTADNPAEKGSVVQLFGTGGGVLTPGVIEGGVAGNVLSVVSPPYSATVNGEDAVVLYAGTAPTLVFGVNQVNIRIPADAPSGAIPIVVNVGTSHSPADLTVFVK
jgi:uncharacterized protein (TIGR03437 family)